MRPIILASGSPRRRELLSSLGIAFEVRVHDLDESLFDHLEPPSRVLSLAEAKARAVMAELPAGEDCLVLGADTLVCDPLPSSARDEEFRDPSGAVSLGKPGGRTEAEAMIRLLSGRVHWVHTGVAVCLSRSGRSETILSSSRISFARLSEAEVEAYLDSGEWEGVAGGYRIQGRAALHIEGIEGSWSGIVGLPIRELYVILTRLGVEMPGNFRP